MKYLFEARYTPTAAQGLINEGGSERRKVVQKMVHEAGGTIDAFYYAFGDVDGYVIVEVPDSATAAAISMAINASGAVKATARQLMTAEEMDAATKKKVAYRAPGA